MKKIKWQLVGIGIVGLLALVWLWPKNRVVVDSGKTWDGKKTGEVFVDSYLPVELKTPKEIEWNLEDTGRAEKAGVWWYETNLLTRMGQTFLMEVGLKKENKSLDDGITTTYSDNQGKSVYINNSRKELEYVVEIKNKGQLLSATTKDMGKVKDDLRSLLSRVNGVEVEIAWGEIRYMKMFYPRWEEATEIEAEVAEISGDYLLEGKRVRTFYGNSVVAIVRKDGELLKLLMTAMPISTKVESEKQVIKLADLKYRKLEAFGIVKIEGGLGFEGNWDVGEIGKIVVNRAELVTIVDTRSGRLRSYYWLSGSARSGVPLRVELITSARQ